MKADTKPASKRRRAALREETGDLRAELDDFIRCVPNLSPIELNQAKEKLIQKVALTTDKASSRLIADVREKIYPNIIPFSIIIGTVGLAWSIVRGHGGQEVNCNDFKKKKKCEKTSPCAWCPKRLCKDGSEADQYCYDSTKENCYNYTC
ncbi:hypothetical protein C8R21_10286 [Nitrosospira multiformis]|uniref:Uncharacterized protein n=1 Tax=Nitrosospira multiformis TaxID=1231 RepID=A0A2T5IGX2_9PROT|nr:hypothetical protein [Nitrosospira multiformis]PTQ83083.1 hypothetical protein C8R21_10286 [Nitrosospira multiformis]